MADGHCVGTCQQTYVQGDTRNAPVLPSLSRVARTGKKRVQLLWLPDRRSSRSNVLGSCAGLSSRAMPSGSQSAWPFAGNAVHRLKAKDSRYSLNPESNLLPVGGSMPSTIRMALEGTESLRPKRGVEALNAIPGYPDAPKGPRYYLGMDFGTSGARAIVIDGSGAIIADAREGYGEKAAEDWAGAWEKALFRLLDAIPADVRSHVISLAIDGTSATALLLDRKTGAVLKPPKLYNESQKPDMVAKARQIAPPAHTATASTSTLCKLLTWDALQAWQELAALGQPSVLAHQADWLAFLLTGRIGVTDWNNALKLGYDPETEEWPDWLTSQPFAELLPGIVVAPGTYISDISPEVAERTHLPPDCAVCAGTTDSIAAFLAAGATEVGQAVTSLGSTLAVKLLSDRRVDDAAYGVYSHRLDNVWLVGGASNTGGAVLRQHFTDAQLAELTHVIEERGDVAHPTGLDYYPLPCPGERFPVNDPSLLPRMERREGDDDATFLHGILEGIASVEAQAYSLLNTLGASPLDKVFTAGGGAKNPMWTAIRQAKLGVPVIPSPQGEAAYGAALLARENFEMES